LPFRFPPKNRRCQSDGKPDKSSKAVGAEKNRGKGRCEPEMGGYQKEGTKPFKKGAVQLTQKENGLPCGYTTRNQI